jgi:hypothetical protein
MGDLRKVQCEVTLGKTRCITGVRAYDGKYIAVGGLSNYYAGVKYGIRIFKTIDRLMGYLDAQPKKLNIIV